MCSVGLRSGTDVGLEDLAFIWFSRSSWGYLIRLRPGHSSSSTSNSNVACNRSNSSQRCSVGLTCRPFKFLYIETLSNYLEEGLKVFNRVDVMATPVSPPLGWWPTFLQPYRRCDGQMSTIFESHTVVYRKMAHDSPKKVKYLFLPALNCEPKKPLRWRVN